MNKQDITEYKRLLIGCRDWEHTTWDAAYYPADLPRDWQLSYYANEMGCVLLPAARWQDASCAELTAWRDDVPEGFLFFLQLETGESGERVCHPGEALGTALGGLLGPTLIPGVAVPVAPPRSKGGSAGMAGPSRSVLLLDVEGKNLRDKRELLETMADQFERYDQTAIILTAPGLMPSEVIEFQQLAELMDFA